MTAFARIGQHTVTHAVVYVPSQGPWYVDIDLELAPDLSGQITLMIGDVPFVGTIDDRYSGTFGERRHLRLVAGAGGWGKPLPAKPYHSDSGVRALLIAQDAAREAGEWLSEFHPAQDSVGRDFSRRGGAASIALERAAGGVPWWVDYAGNTHVEPHPSTTPAVDTYEVLRFDPAARVAQIAVDTADVVKVGATLTERLDGPVVVRELEIHVGENLRLMAWCGPASAEGRLIAAVRSIIRRETASKIYGPTKYRIGQMNGDRYELQIVNRATGLPNVIPCSAMPGVGGAHAVFEASAGTIVLVQFIDGDPEQPVITHFAGKDGNGWIPREAIYAASEVLRLASATADKALAVAEKVDDRLSTIVGDFNSHTHLDPVSGSTGTPETPMVAPAPTGSSKIMGVL